MLWEAGMTGVSSVRIEPRPRGALRRLLRLVGTYLATLLLFSAALILANLVPTQLMRGNVSDSSQTMLAEGGDYPVMAVASPQIWQVDNFTNALMLNIASHGDNLGVRGAFGAYYYSDPEISSQTEGLRPSLDVQADASDPSFTSYARYWHGYLVFLKPLLVFLDIAQIRMLLFLLVSTLIVAVSVILQRMRGIVPALAFSAPFFVCAYPVTCFSLSFAPCFVIALVSSLLILLRAPDGRIRHASSSFFIIGALTVYLDFLCNPIITLGIPLGLLIYLRVTSGDGRGSWSEVVRLGLTCFFSWCCGYGLLWVSKWVLSSLVTGRDVVRDGVGNLLYRSGSSMAAAEGGGDISRLDAVALNFSYMFPRWLLALLAAIVLITLFVSVRRNGLPSRDGVISAFLVLAVGLAPYAWYFFTANHSYHHAFFAFRSQVATLMTVFLCVDVLCKRVTGATSGRIAKTGSSGPSLEQGMHFAASDGANGSRD